MQSEVLSQKNERRISWWLKKCYTLQKGKRQVVVTTCKEERTQIRKIFDLSLLFYILGNYQKMKLTKNDRNITIILGEKNEKTNKRKETVY